MKQANITVLRKILYAVESGGQVYGKQDYAAFARVGENTPNEKAITIGAGQWYAGEAKRLLQLIQSKYPTDFKRLDNAGIAADLKKSWDRYGVTKSSTKGKCILAIITCPNGIKCQDTLMEDQIKEYAASITKTYGSMGDDAMMECINIIHQGGRAALKRILGKTKKPYTAKTIYAALCTDPADKSSNNQVGDYTGRQKKVYEYITKYAVTDKKEEGKMEVRMSNCGHDENNRYSGGKAGDQTGTEWYLRPWYAYPWNYILRWKDKELANLFADLATEAAQNNNIGYDQGQRTTFGVELQKVGWRPSKIKTPCEADCSKGTIDLIRAVGHLKGIKELQNCANIMSYTGNMMDWFRSAAGKKHFEILTGKYLTDSSLAKRGDINLNTAHHVNITVDNGLKAGNSSAPAATPNTYQAQAQQHLNNFVNAGLAIDGDVGTETKKAFRKAIQSALNMDYNTGLELDGDIGDQSRAALKKVNLKKGSSGYLVTVLEIGMLMHGINPKGVECPGSFGDGLKKALGTFQAKKGLAKDYEAGYDTFMMLQK